MERDGSGRGKRWAQKELMENRIALCKIANGICCMVHCSTSGLVSSHEGWNWGLYLKEWLYVLPYLSSDFIRFDKTPTFHKAIILSIKNNLKQSDSNINIEDGLGKINKTSSVHKFDNP